jgi:xanthine dehydrogenase YagR molybdenum-binding subunit
MTELIGELRTPVADVGTGSVTVGMAVSRVDGRAKVTGRATYAAEHPADDLVYGVVVNSTIATGRIVSIDAHEALMVQGVVDVLTHLNRPKMRSFGLVHKDMTAPAGSPFKPLHDERIVYSGQPVALVVAETFEVARHAASLVRVVYDEQPHDTDLVAALSRQHAPKPFKVGFKPPPSEKGDADAAFAAAAVTVDSEFISGVEHHNPMELFATTVIRGDDGHLTIYDKTQSSINSRWYVSHVFGLHKNRVTVRNPYVGGAFGAGLRPQYQLPLAVMATLQLERSVRVVMTRQQMFTFGHRPETWQRVRLAADQDGTLRSISHHAVAETSRFEDYTEVIVNWSGQLYRCDNIRMQYDLVDLDRFSPIDMRAPGAAHGLHALEVAMDELAGALHMDPLTLRMHNYAERDPMDDLEYSTKQLRACYEKGAQRFGWSKRPMEPRSMRDGNELIGWGMATGMWDALQMFARTTATLHPGGRLVVSSAASDIGTGTYTVMSQIAAAALGLPMEHVSFQLGDSTLPIAPVEGGSSHVTTIGSAVQGVCEKLQKQLLAAALTMPGSPLDGATLRQVEFVDARIRLIGQPAAAVPIADVVAHAGRPLDASYTVVSNMVKKRKFVRATHSAVFCEVRVDEEFGTVRVTRVVSAIDSGRIINAKTARSQITGAVVWGISQALHEETHTDHRLGRFMNRDLAEYHVAVNADIGDIDVIFVEEDDQIVSRIGAKGIGEIGIIGVSAAVSNAIHHATGRRIRSTPMTPDRVMRPPG